MKFVCMNCLTEPYLRTAQGPKVQRCSYCSELALSVPLTGLSRVCLSVLSTHFEVTHNEASVVHHDRQPRGNDLHGTLRQLKVVAEPVLHDLVECTLAAWRENVRKWPEDGDDTDAPWFQIRSDLHHTVNRHWLEMERSLRLEARFLNRRALEVLDQVFDGLHQGRTSGGGGVVIEAGPGHPITELIRARVFQTEDALKEALKHPAKHFGTPPPGVGQAGRMNAKGQPVFYGATTEDVALAEVRPPVGSFVVTATFQLIRVVKLLDLDSLARIQLDPNQSLFAPVALAMAQRRDFLRMLATRLVQPVMPELQDRDYLITQVVADYLASHKDGPIDGILYPSAQKDGSGDSGVNVALFPRSSRVEHAVRAPWAEVNLWGYEEDGPGQWLEPVVNLCPPPPPDPLDLLDHLVDGDILPWDTSLRIDLSNINVHEITGVTVNRKTHRVAVFDPSTST